MEPKEFIKICKQQIKRNISAKDYHNVAYWAQRLGDFLLTNKTEEE